MVKYPCGRLAEVHSRGSLMFRRITDFISREAANRVGAGEKRLRFGIEFLDNATRGIVSDDVILLGAPSGVGKSQLCCLIALANMLDGRRVHYIALEAGEFEVERRLLFPLVMERFLADPNRPRIGFIEYADWYMGTYYEQMKTYEEEAAAFFAKAYQSLFVLYKGERFGVAEMIEQVGLVSDETDLIIVDHIHYFDFDDDNETRAIRNIAKTARSLALEQQKPIILVAHLRKRDNQNNDLVAGQEEFHGSSDLFKIATKVITVAPGKPTADGRYETYFRIPKMRLDGGVTRFIGKEIFNPKTGGYEHGKYTLGWADAGRKKGFEGIDRTLYPRWAKGQIAGGGALPPVSPGRHTPSFLVSGPRANA